MTRKHDEFAQILPWKTLRYLRHRNGRQAAVEPAVEPDEATKKRASEAWSQWRSVGRTVDALFSNSSDGPNPNARGGVTWKELTSRLATVMAGVATTKSIDDVGDYTVSTIRCVLRQFGLRFRNDASHRVLEQYVKDVFGNGVKNRPQATRGLLDAINNDGGAEHFFYFSGLAFDKGDRREIAQAEGLRDSFLADGAKGIPLAWICEVLKD